MAKNRKLKLNLDIKGFIRNNLKHFKDAIVQAAAEGDSSDPKAPGEVRLERAVAIVNDLVDIPFVPEVVEERIFKFVITAVVEFAMAQYGKKTWVANL